MRTGKHLTRDILLNYSDGQFFISDELKVLIDTTTKDYNLWKIKIFDQSGKTIYSTSESDIGVINNQVYFSTIVTEGKTYTKLVKKIQ
ncbi:MAG: hypothetical protein GY777_02970 [Candidatus Brocadiaceae bacterium]|nr:hypothetical protein [Candidatus Brocadiaceae bacterium]